MGVSVWMTPVAAARAVGELVPGELRCATRCVEDGLTLPGPTIYSRPITGTMDTVTV